jgi:O-antigen/teichoic acid export membrane protein
VLLHGSVYTASRFLNHGVVLVLLPVYSHFLGAEGMGIVEIMVVARTFLAVVLAQGLDSALYRLRFDATGDELARLESTIIWYLLGSSAVAFAILSAFGERIGAVLTPGVAFLPLGLWSAATAVALLFASLLERKLQGSQRPFAFGAFSLVRSILTLSTIVFFVAFLRRGAAGKIEGEAIAAILAASFAIVALAPKLRASLPLLKKALRYGLPVVPHSIAGIVNDQIDRFVLSAMLGLQAVGVYSMGYRLAGVAMGMTMAQNQAFSPVFMETMQRAERAEANGDAGTAKSLKTRIASLGMTNILVGCTVAQLVGSGARELLALATTPAFGDSWRVVGPVAAGVVSWSWYGTLSQSIMFRTESVRRLPLITISAAVANLGTNVLLIPRLGIDGAAWATFVSNSALATGAFYLGTRSVSIPYAFRRWAITSAWACVCLAVTWQLDANLDAFVPRIFAKAVWFAASIHVMLRLGGVRMGEIARIFSAGRFSA